jgi:hypothetical protein
LSTDLPRWIKQTKDAVLPILIDTDTYVSHVDEIKAGRISKEELIRRLHRVIVLCETMQQAEKVVAISRLLAYILVANANKEPLNMLEYFE